MFKYDSGIMTFLGKVTDIVILNLLTLICCIPIITIGASITAAHYTALKMHRDTDNYVVRNFFRSFKNNLLQSTIIWIIWIAAELLSVFAFMYYPDGGIGTFFKIVIGSVMIFIALTTMWLFPMQSRFANPIFGTIRNAFFFACRYLLRTLGMVLITIGAVVLWLFISPRWYWLILIFGLSVPIYLCAMIYNKVFLKWEDQIIASQNPDEDETEAEQIVEQETDEQNLIEQNIEEQDVE